MGWGSVHRVGAPALLIMAALALPVAAGAAPMQPKGLPLTITLPSGWTVSAVPAGAKFSATIGTGGLIVTSGGIFPGGVPFSEFVRTESTSAKAYYRGKDAHASVTASKITLPSGPAVLTKVSYKSKGNPLVVYLYSLLHNGVTYHFTFWTNASSIGSAKGTFASAAKSVHFTS